MNYDIAIFIAIIFIIAIICLWLGSIMYADPPIQSVVGTTGTSTITRRCLPGQCAINIYSGVKRCPVRAIDVEHASITSELCSSEFICDNVSAPIAIDDRGVAIIGSTCPSGVTCQCLSGQYCGEHIMSYFQPFWSTQDPLTKYAQSTTVKDVLGKTHTTPPFYIPKGQGVCTISPTLYKDYSLDTGSCLFGTMAYYPESGSTVGGLTTPLACVRGMPCDRNRDLTAVWNPSFNRIDCKEVVDSVIVT